MQGTWQCPRAWTSIHLLPWKTPHSTPTSGHHRQTRGSRVQLSGHLLSQTSPAVESEPWPGLHCISSLALTWKGFLRRLSTAPGASVTSAQNFQGTWKAPTQHLGSKEKASRHPSHLTEFLEYCLEFCSLLWNLFTSACSLSPGAGGSLLPRAGERLFLHSGLLFLASGQNPCFLFI